MKFENFRIGQKIKYKCQDTNDYFNDWIVKRITKKDEVHPQQILLEKKHSERSFQQTTLLTEDFKKCIENNIQQLTLFD